MPITTEQLQQLQQMVAQIVQDKEVADVATTTSNAADAVLATATGAAHQAKLDEATADARLTAGVKGLAAFMDGLAAPAPGA